MTPSFSLSRLWLLIKKQYHENASLYFYSVLSLAGLLIAFFVIWITTGSNTYQEETLYFFFYLILYFYGASFAARQFAILGDRNKGIHSLMLPASHLEKLLTAVFYTIVVFLVVYLLCFFIMKELAIAYLNRLITHNPGKYKFIPLDPHSSVAQMKPVFLYGFVAIQSFYLLGSISFPRNAFVITTVAGSLILFLFFAYMFRLENLFIGEPYVWSGLKVDEQSAGSGRSVAETTKQYELPAYFRESLLLLLKFGWLPFLGCVSWLKLKEKQL